MNHFGITINDVLDSGPMFHVGILLLSLVIPVAIYSGRNNLRNHRRKVVRDLAAMFDFATADGGRPIVIPSLELVKYKYDPESTASAPGMEEEQSGLWHYAVPVGLYVLLAFLGFRRCFYPSAFSPSGALSQGTLQKLNSFVLGGMRNPDSGQLASFAANGCYTFLGAYLWTIFYLIKRVSNFDLSPLSFLRCSAQIVFAGFVSAAVWHTGNSFFGEKPVSIAGVAFLIGWFPDLGLKYLITKYPSMQLKRVTAATNELCEELPLDCITGIDAFMKFRLAEFEIEDVQNLATINPIQLFVETPYGLYEVIDWVAQAQLILAVGASKTLALRKLNVRTIFDLENVVHQPLFRKLVLKILLSSSPQSNPEPNHLDALSDEASSVLLTDMIAVIREDLHVQRLRQIWEIIAVRLHDRPVPRDSGYNGLNPHLLVPGTGSVAPDGGKAVLS
jgi:hypothetical protein